MHKEWAYMRPTHFSEQSPTDSIRHGIIDELGTGQNGDFEHSGLALAVYLTPVGQRPFK